jgi:probable F420-dependent oxidoreductase
MEFGVCLPQYGREVSLDELRAVASDAESLGFGSVWVSDHVVTPEHLQKNIGPVFFDAFVVLSHVSALTGRVRLGTTVMVAPYRNPLVAAKMIATLDSLSGGRVILGIGAGGAPDEFAALGVPESQRGIRTDEYLSAMIELWSSDPSSFLGRHVSFEGVRFAPKPTQKPHPPIWVGGRRDAALRRAVRFGQAWHPTQMPLDALRERMERLAEFSGEAGRAVPPATTVHQSVAFEADGTALAERRLGRGSPAQVAYDMAAYAEMGIPAVVCNFRGVDTDTVRRAMETFARQVMPQVRGQV